MKRFYLLTIFIFCKLMVSAQHDGAIHGTLMDTALRQPVQNATITVMDSKDSSLVAFSRTEQNGKFSIKGLTNGKFRLLITHIGYRNISKNFVIADSVREIDFGFLVLNNRADVLKEITVTQEAAPVTVKQDTIEYNAGSFKTKPNAVVEDLLKKLPGIQVDKNGTIKANGEEVKKVLVDGKEFFGNDPKIASKNLPADAVDKVQVFDKKSDQSQFTGFDDGNSQKAINLTIKQDKKNGVFGKVTAGAGDNDRYEGRANINEFKGSRQLSFIGMANNTNKQGFAFQDVMNFTGGMSAHGGRGTSADPIGSGIAIQGLTDNNRAITTTLAGGLNFSNTWNTKTDFTGSYFYNRTDDKIDQNVLSQYLVPGNAFTQKQHSVTDSYNENHRLNTIVDTKIDSSNSFRLSSTFIYQNSSNNSLSNYNSTAESGTLINDGFSNSYAKGNGYNWNNSMLFRHRFSKKGRTLSANFSFITTNSSGSGSLYSINNYYQPVNIDTLNQVNNQNGKSNNYGVNLVYTEPLSKKTLIEFNYNFVHNDAQSDKKTFDADASGKFNIPNEQLTNDFNNSYTYNRQGLHLRNQQKDYSLSFGATMEETNFKNDFKYLSSDSLLKQSFFNILPDAELQYNFNKYKHVRLFYNTFTRQPSTTQLQPVPDNSDPLNVKIGNPNLEQEYHHVLRMNYVTFDPFQHTSFFAMINLLATHNKIVNDDRINSDGQRLSIPVNLNGLYTVNGSLSWGFPVRKIKSNLNLNSNVSYDHNANLVNNVRNNSNGWTISQGADLNFYYKELLDITGSAKISYNDNRYSLQPDQNVRYWTQNYTLDFNIYLPKGFSIATDVDYIRRTGLPAGYNTNPVIWNAGVAKQLFNNKKGEIRFQVFDILKQNIGFSRNTNENYIQDISYKVLNRFWLLSFTYNINRFAGKSMNVGGRQQKLDLKIMN
ncbi:MAG: outer membrane beta-barrel protein [Bacteroidetes bacterium]|nr:outer membrane beta-barrel protein [Bacteroidota bacterium]